MDKKEKKISIELLRVSAMICVVLLHSIASGLRCDYSTLKWDILNILSSFATASVPIFFMISGALILSSEKTYSIEYTLKKRLPRILIPTVFWSFIAVVKEYGFIWYWYGIKDIWGAFTKFLTFPQNYVMVHFWFMYFLIPLYLISPAVKFFLDKAPEVIIKYIGILWLINILCFTLKPVLPAFLQPLSDLAFIKNIGFVNDYLGHFVLGYYLYTKKFRITNLQLNAAILASVGVIAVVTAYMTKSSGQYSEWFKSYKNIAVIILSSAVFIRFLRITSLPKAAVIIINKISPLTFGIYLFHNIYISSLGSLGLKIISAKTITRVFFETLIVSVIVVSIIDLIKKLPKILKSRSVSDKS